MEKITAANRDTCKMRSCRSLNRLNKVEKMLGALGFLLGDAGMVMGTRDER
jgi:hypothetical protein